MEPVSQVIFESNPLRFWIPVAVAHARHLLRIILQVYALRPLVRREADALGLRQHLHHQALLGEEVVAAAAEEVQELASTRPQAVIGRL